jgi:hypothetical protein
MVMIIPSLRIQKNEIAREVIRVCSDAACLHPGDHVTVHAGDVHANRVPPSRFPFWKVRYEANALGVMEFN